MKEKLYLISTLAENQTFFWIKVAQKLINKNIKIVFISFDEVSYDYLINSGFECYFFNNKDFVNDVSDYYFNKIMKKFNITDYKKYFLHERIAFNINDEIYLRNKFLACLKLSERVIKSLSGKFHISLIQELGGFLSVISCFFVAKKFKIDNYFIEPSFFKGYFFLIKNSFYSLKINSLKNSIRPNKKMMLYINDAILNKTVVIPKKDSHHYSLPSLKIFNIYNTKRLISKIFNKFVLRKRYEFSYIGFHVKKHIQMWANNYKLRPLYSTINDLDNFIYYPLHVPNDVSLTIRAPSYINQLFIIENILKKLSGSKVLAIKEHPAMIGSIDYSGFMKLQKNYKNLKLIDPKLNNYSVISKAALIVSVNSKSGAESLLLNKKVIVLGDCFYYNFPNVYICKDILNISILINKILEKNINYDDKILSYFEMIWDESLQGELYYNNNSNINNFTKSLLSVC